MDPVTHTLTGAVLAETRLGRLTPLAGAALVIGANLPDVDVATYAVSADFALAHRRGWTHGALAVALLPPLLTGLLLLYDRWRRRAGRDRPPARPWPLLALSYLAVATHPALDWCNTYGVRLLYPFDRRWFYGDALFIVDPWLWLLLGGAVFLLRSRDGRSLALWAGLGAPAAWLVLSGGGGERPGTDPALPLRLLWAAGLAALVLLRLRRTPRRLAAGTLAAAAFGLSGLYAGAMALSGCRARQVVAAELARRGVPPLEGLMVGPEPVDPFHRQVVAALPGEYLLGRFSWLGEPRLTLTGRLDVPPPSPVVREALSAPEVRGMAGWMRFPFYAVEEGGAGTTVYLLDARYTHRPTRGFGGAVVHLPPTETGPR